MSAVPVAQWAKGWPSDLAVRGLIPTGGGNLSNCMQGSSSSG